MPVSLKRLLVGRAFSALGNGLTLPLLIVCLHEIRGIATGMGCLGASALILTLRPRLSAAEDGRTGSRAAVG